MAYFPSAETAIGIDSIDIKTNKKIEESVSVYTCGVRKRDRDADPFFLYNSVAYVDFIAILLPFIRGRYLESARWYVMTGVGKRN